MLAIEPSCLTVIALLAKNCQKSQQPHNLAEYHMPHHKAPPNKRPTQNNNYGIISWGLPELIGKEMQKSQQPRNLAQ
jgi:hypothetical protein